MKPYFLGFYLLILSVGSAQTCNLKLSGKIIDFHNNTPLYNAQIYINELGISTYSDNEGYFQIHELCDGYYTVFITHEACDPLQIELDLKEDKDVVWYLEHHIVQLQNIETVGQPKRAVQTLPEHHIHTEEIEKYSAESIGSVLKSQVGVSALETGNSIVKPMIHGMHSSRIVMMNRGVRQEDMEWGVEHSPNIDLNAFEDIRILKGASALRYGGDAIGGIVITEATRLPKKDTLLGKVSATGILNGKGGNVNFQLLKGFESPWAFQLQGSYKKHGDYKSPDYYLTNTGSEQKAISSEVQFGDFMQNIKIDYSFFDTTLGILKASHLGNLNDLVDAINNDMPFVQEDFSYTINKPYQKIQHHLAKIKAEKRFRNFGKWEIQYAYQFNNRQEFDVRNGEVTDVPSMDVELSTQTVETHLRLDKFDKISLDGGVDYTYQDNYTNPATQVKRLIPDYNKHKAGIYGVAAYAPNNQWNFTSGFRYDFTHFDTQKYYYKRYWNQMGYDAEFANHIIGDYGNQWLTHFELDYHNISATIGVSYKKLRDTEVSLNYAYANRAPNPAELFSEGLHHAAVSIELGDVRLRPEHAHKISLNLDKKWEVLEGMNFNVLGYFNRINNYIYQVPTGAEYTIRGAFPVWEFQQIDAHIFGVDLETKLQVSSRINYATQLSWTQGRDKSHQLPLIMMPPLDWQQSLTYRWDNRFNPFITINTQYVARQNDFPDYNFSLTVLENGETQNKIVDISSPPNDYFLVGMEAGVTFHLKQNPLLIQAKVNNLSNVSYRNYLNRFRYYADEMGRQIQLQVIYKF